MAPQLTSSDITYFSQMAGIAATLLGLSFLALTFGLTGLFARYRTLELPVFLHEVQRSRRLRAGGKPRQATLLDPAPERRGFGNVNTAQRSPEDVTDLQLFDSDPLVVFMAFSISLSWNLYFLALILALTIVAEGSSGPWIVGGEMVAFLAILTYSVTARHRHYRRLDTYRTADERLWTPGECAILVFDGAMAAFACWAALAQSCSTRGDGLCALAQPLTSGTWSAGAYVAMLKVVPVLAVCLALYVTNKDLFVYFKAKASEEMRGRWLARFVAQYADWERRVEAILSDSDTWAGAAGLRDVWNGGYPPRAYHRPELNRGAPADGEVTRTNWPPRWRQLIAGQPTVASWMFDVPGIAAWQYDVDERLHAPYQARVSG